MTRRLILTTEPDPHKRFQSFADLLRDPARRREFLGLIAKTGRDVERGLWERIARGDVSEGDLREILEAPWSAAWLLPLLRKHAHAQLGRKRGADEANAKKRARAQANRQRWAARAREIWLEYPGRDNESVAMEIAEDEYDEKSGRGPSSETIRKAIQIHNPARRKNKASR